MSEAWAIGENQRGETLLTPYARALKVGGGKPGQGYPAALISSSGDGPVRTTVWPVNGPVLGASVAASGLSSPESCASCGQRGFSQRMSLDFYPALEDVTSGRSSAIWTTSGTAWRGRYW